MPINSRKPAATPTAAGSTSSAPLSSTAARIEPELFHLSPNGWMPNNERLPVLLYRGAFDVSGPDPAAVFEQAFARNGWPAQWRNSVYDFHHYHSTAHEILGFVVGEARLVLGGQGGPEIDVRAGDVIVLPAGAGHSNLHNSPDFLAIGAYPLGQDWDTCRSAPSTEDLARIRALPFPDSDPVTGANGPLTRHWRRA